ncbi:MAG: NADH-quinone oxidoreductase subunit NuoF [Limnochordia bacterium]|nr:NADH-quinone oxidoreductase subunit NuoF [Bacillota bacterium]HQD71121.1 NADH-quinone oxidoreductase subunit NuoF [Limnochordia bacterium]
MADRRFTIKVGLASCGIAAGAQQVYDEFANQLSKAELNADLILTGCLGMCYCEPLVEVSTDGHERYLYGNVGPGDVDRIISQHLAGGEPVRDLLVYAPGLDPEMDLYFAKQVRIALKNCGVINPEDIASYLKAGGYQGLRKALEIGPEAVIEEIKASGLRGRGGAGFPTWLKWSLTRQASGDVKYVICNADEGDPGAFMDRSILESDPHSVIEGMLIAAYAIGAGKGYIYCRAEYPLAIKRLRLAIGQAEACGFLGGNIQGSGFDFSLEIREGAGAFVCGEETALIMSMEGKRGMPRFRPPYPSEKGLFGAPTSINNVETYANVPRILQGGAEAYSKYGTEKSKGTKVFALAGKVKRGGLVEIPMGMTIDEIVFDIGGGISTGKAFKAIQTGGPSGGCIPASLGGTPVDYESLGRIGAIMGSGGLLVMDEDTCMVDVAKYFLTFARGESCGKCTFCRVGSEKMLEILERITSGKGTSEDLSLIKNLGEAVKSGSMCGLGQTMPNPVLTTLQYFAEEYQAHIDEAYCPARQCKALISYHIDPDRCRGCGLCAKVCAVGAISGELRKPYTIDSEVCVRCGLCAAACRFDAIDVVSRPKSAEASLGVAQ